MCVQTGVDLLAGRQYNLNINNRLGVVMQIQEIKAAIISSNLTIDDLNEVIEAVKYARTQLGRQVARTISIGTNVRFTGRDGRVVTGTVQGIKIKNAVVQTGMGRYRVPMSLLEVA
jgi:hypothetical protein